MPVVQEGSWRKGAAYSAAPETAAAELNEGGAMARNDMAPEDLSAFISVIEFAINKNRFELEFVIFYINVVAIDRKSFKLKFEP